MKVQIIATRQCTHRVNLEHELNDLGVAYELLFAEDNPDLVARHQIRHSPNLVVDDQIAFRGQPTEQALRDYFSHGT